MKTPVRLLMLALFACFAVSASGQTVTLTASNIGGHTKVASGQLCVTPVDASNHPLPASALGGSSGGAITYEPACVPVTSGAISPLALPDTALTTPTNLCLRITVSDTSQNGRIIYTATCAQPASTGQTSWCTTTGGVTTCNFDKYHPNLPTLALQTAGPAGPAGATGATGPTGAAGAVNCSPGPCGTNGDFNVAGKLFTGGYSFGPSLPFGIDIYSFFGDSLTGGSEDGTGITYPQQVATLTSHTANNYGIGGQRSGDIAVRMNAYAGTSNQQFASGFTIPTSGSVAVTFVSGYEPAFNWTSPRSPYPNGIPITFTVSGTAYSGYVVASGSIPTFTYAFTPSVYPGSPVTVPSGTAWTTVLNVGDLTGCVGIGAGENNFGSSAQVEADIAAMVATVSASTQCYAVFSILNQRGPASYWSGGAAYTTITGINSYLSTTYGTHYIDVRSNLVAQYNPANAADVIDHGHDVPPTSLMAQTVTGTMTSAIGDTTTCAFSTSTAAGLYELVVVDSEVILVQSGSNGAYTCTRGYAGTTAATHSNGAAMAIINALHPGQNVLYSAANLSSSCTTSTNTANGYICWAKQFNTWLNSTNSTSSYVTFNSMNRMNYAQNNHPITAQTLNVGLPGQSTSTLTATPSGAWVFTGLPTLYGCSATDACFLSLGAPGGSGWGAMYLHASSTAASFKACTGGYTGTSCTTFGPSGMAAGDGSGATLSYAADASGNLVVNGHGVICTTCTGAFIGAVSNPFQTIYGAHIRAVNSGFYDELTPDTLTASRSAFVPDGTSATVMSATLTTTASTTDSVTVTGMTSTGHCAMSPRNASAATNIATTYISTKAAGSITVTHTATSGMIYDFLCSSH